MSGNPAADPKRKIQAVTVSVNYADYLECIAPNRVHFDRWIVVTEESDRRTREVCARHGMDVVFSRRLREGGAVFNKAAALNEGLGALDPDAWAAVLDSDILLPPDFRARLDRQKLNPHWLYGLAGRRICETSAEFAALARQAPWGDNLTHATFIIGYFNLFHPATSGARYPEDVSDDASTYDLCFSDQFPAARRHYLPFVCLHAGSATENWRGRKSDPFLNGPQIQPPAADSTPEIAECFGGPDKHAVQIGCYHGEPGRTLARQFGRVTVFDHWGLTIPAVSPAMETDRQWLYARYLAESAGAANLSGPLEHTTESVAAIPDASVDLLWLTAEPEYDFLLQALPLWLPKLKPGAAVAGGFFDRKLLPVTAGLVSQLFGEPTRSYPDGKWVRRLADPAAWLDRVLPRVPEAGRRGVVYVAMVPEEVEPLLVSLHSLRRCWTGPVCVLNAGDESSTLRLACARLGIQFRNLPDDREPDLSFIRALEWTPFAESLFLGSPTLVRGPVEPLFDRLSNHKAVFWPGVGKWSATPGLGAFVWSRESPFASTWASLTASLLPELNEDAMRIALQQMRHDGLVHLEPPGAVWSGPARRIPPQAAVQYLERPARACALHLYRPWEEEQQAQISSLQLPAE